MSKKTIKAAVAACVLALGAAGIAQAKSPVPGKPGKENIVDFAIAANSDGPTEGKLDTLLTAATCDYFDEAVVNLLAGNKRHTLFAPTDDAFEQLGLRPDNVCATFEADPSGLFNILAYHVTEGRRFSNSVFNKRSVKMVGMLNDQFIMTLGGKDPTITDNKGRTIRPVAGLINLNASNGVIHVIDSVLLP
jgi:uncharacterized surface protein with fasciclin (FAS1) repeats